MSATRRKVPLTTVASHRARHRVHGGRSCSGGVPARRDDVRTPAGRSRRWRWRNTRWRHAGIAVAAAVAVVRRSSRSTRTRRAPGRSRRPRCSCCSCARPAHGTGRTGAAGLSTPRAATSGGRPCWRRAICTPTAGRCWSAQADPGQLRAQVGVASLGQPPTMHLRAAGVLAWDQPAKPHELGGMHKPAPVGTLGRQPQRAQPGDAPVGGQPGDLPVERGRSHQPTRSASTASSCTLRTSTTAR